MDLRRLQKVPERTNQADILLKPIRVLMLPLTLRRYVATHVPKIRLQLPRRKCSLPCLPQPLEILTNKEGEVLSSGLTTILTQLTLDRQVIHKPFMKQIPLQLKFE